MDRIIQELPEFFGYYNNIFTLKAAWTTLVLSALGSSSGFCIGFVLAAIRRTSSWWLAPARISSTVFVESFRRIPFLVTLMLVFFAFNIMGYDVSVFWVAVLAVCLIATAYISEIVRAGLNSVHQNQWDTATAMNFGLVRSLYFVVVPQSWKVILPPAFAFFILYVKDTALASHIGVEELTYVGKMYNTKGFSPFLSWGSILIIYFALSYPLVRLGAWLERRAASRIVHSKSP